LDAERFMTTLFTGMGEEVLELLHYSTSLPNHLPLHLYTQPNLYNYNKASDTSTTPSSYA